MITAEEYQTRLANDTLGPALHVYTGDTDSPVVQVEITLAQNMGTGLIKYEFRAVDGGNLPEWQAGAHLDIVVAPEFLRQYSMSGDPADRSKYQIGVLLEDAGRGGSKLLHRIFSEGRKVFVSKPINHFPVHPDATFSLLMGGGIGITPMIAMAHELHQAGRDFALHYSGRSRAKMGYLDDLAVMPWVDKVHLHITDEDTRADLDQIMVKATGGWHVYTCGADRYMSSVMDAAEVAGVAEDARHLEYFSVPEVPEYENHDFTLKLTKSGKSLHVPADKSATDVLAENGIKVDVKCSDGICGVCKCGLVSGDVEHRDFVLSKAQRANAVILCQSRAAEKDGVIEVDL